MFGIGFWLKIFLEVQHYLKQLGRHLNFCWFEKLDFHLYPNWTRYKTTELGQWPKIKITEQPFNFLSSEKCPLLYWYANKISLLNLVKFFQRLRQPIRHWTDYFDIKYLTNCSYQGKALKTSIIFKVYRVVFALWVFAVYIVRWLFDEIFEKKNSFLKTF